MNWVDKVSQPPSRISKLTFRVLALCHNDCHPWEYLTYVRNLKLSITTIVQVNFIPYSIVCNRHMCAMGTCFKRTSHEALNYQLVVYYFFYQFLPIGVYISWWYQLSTFNFQPFPRFSSFTWSDRRHIPLLQMFCKLGLLAWSDLSDDVTLNS